MHSSAGEVAARLPSAWRLHTFEGFVASKYSFDSLFSFSHPTHTIFVQLKNENVGVMDAVMRHLFEACEKGCQP